MEPNERPLEERGDTPPANDDELVRFGVSMPAALVRDLDRWRKGLGYPSRSEAVRDLVRDALVQTQWRDEGDSAAGEAVGVVLLVYDHTTRQLSDRLTDMQHHSRAKALAALHIHLTLENCLEVVVLRGARADVRELAGHLISARGVLHGVFIPTTTGEELA
ncbi:MAG: nickel-responsive transcriptional regulator NikR [Chthonomonadales bacterium]